MRSRLLKRALPLACLVALLAGCAGHSARTKEARSALDARDPKRALELYNEELEVGSGSELPAETGDDNALLLLDRSTIQQQLVCYKDSSRDLETADKQVEMLDFSRSTADEIGRYLFSDDVGEYKARPFEKLLINTLNMVNYLAEGNLQGAKIEARRFAIMQKYLSQSEDDAGDALMGPGSYLAGFTFEMAGEADEAIRFYDEALGADSYDTLREPVRRLAQRSGYRSPRLTKLIEGAPAPAADDGGDIVVVASYGRVPALHAERIPIGLALTYGALFMDPSQQVAARRMAGQGLVTWVNFPELDKAPSGYAGPAALVDQASVGFDEVTAVDALVRASYEKAKGPIIASAIVRMIARGAVGAGAGTGVAKASNSSALGMLFALGTQAALVATDTPDTRSWATLPARIAIARVRVRPGRHSVKVSAQGTTRVVQVDVRPGRFALVNLTELSQN